MSACDRACEPEFAGPAQSVGAAFARAPADHRLAPAWLSGRHDLDATDGPSFRLAGAAPDGKSVATALVDPGALSDVIALAPLDGAVVALMAAGQETLAAGGVSRVWTRRGCQQLKSAVGFGL